MRAYLTHYLPRYLPTCVCLSLASLFLIAAGQTAIESGSVAGTFIFMVLAVAMITLTTVFKNDR